MIRCRSIFRRLCLTTIAATVGALGTSCVTRSFGRTGADGRIADRQGDVQGVGDGVACPSMIDITGVSCAVTADLLAVCVDVAAIPTEVTSNWPGVPGDHAEFRWIVRFDVDGDGRSSAGDVGLEVVHFRRDGEAVRVGPLDAAVYGYLVYTIDADHACRVPLPMIAAAGMTAAVRITATQICLRVPRGAMPCLARITDRTLIRCDTYWTDGTRHCSDSAPDRGPRRGMRSHACGSADGSSGAATSSWPGVRGRRP